MRASALTAALAASLLAPALARAEPVPEPMRGRWSVDGQCTGPDAQVATIGATTLEVLRGGQRAFLVDIDITGDPANRAEVRITAVTEKAQDETVGVGQGFAVRVEGEKMRLLADYTNREPQELGDTGPELVRCP